MAGHQIGKRLRDLCNLHGLELGFLARKTYIKAIRISSLKAGHLATSAEVEKLAKAFRMTGDEFLNGGWTKHPLPPKLPRLRSSEEDI